MQTFLTHDPPGHCHWIKAQIKFYSGRCKLREFCTNETCGNWASTDDQDRDRKTWASMGEKIANWSLREDASINACLLLPFFFIFSTRRGRQRRHRRRPRARALFFRSCPICPVSTLFFACPFLSCLSFLLPSCCPVWILLFIFSFFLGSLLTDFPAVTKARLKCSSVEASHRMCRVKSRATGSS